MPTPTPLPQGTLSFRRRTTPPADWPTGTLFPPAFDIVLTSPTGNVSANVVEWAVSEVQAVAELTRRYVVPFDRLLALLHSDEQGDRKPLYLTQAHAGMLYEAAELVTQLAHAIDDFDAFTEFNFSDMVMEAFPEASGTEYSPAYRRLEAAIRQAFPLKASDALIAAWTKYGDQIVGRMRAEKATGADDAELARCLSGCVCGGMLVRLATDARDAGLFSPAALVPAVPPSVGEISVAQARAVLDGNAQEGTGHIIGEPMMGDVPAREYFVGPRDAEYTSAGEEPL